MFLKAVLKKQFLSAIFRNRSMMFSRTSLFGNLNIFYLFSMFPIFLKINFVYSALSPIICIFISLFFKIIFIKQVKITENKYSSFPKNTLFFVF